MGGWSLVIGNKNYSSWSLRAWLPLKQDQWLDVFLGEAELCSQRRRSLVDPTARVALHYLPEDLTQIQALECPHERIPPELWQRLIQKQGFSST